MSDNKRTGRGMFGMGYYIALILCAAAIGITSYLYYRNTQDSGDAQILATDPDTAVIATEEGEDIAVIATQLPEEESPVISATEAPQATVKKGIQTTAPVAGEEIMGYSMEALSYNETTRDWRVHNGLDIAAEAGTPVVAAADGEIYTIYEDDTFGTTVVIRHDGGYMTKYASLSQELNVNVGDKVTMGQAIGTVGSTALVETAMGPHVHFSVTYQDLPMDPAEFLKLG